MEKTAKIKSDKFAKTREGFGIVGMTLNLNLAQCKALNFYLNEIKCGIANSDDDKIQAAVVEPLLPFLELFKDIQNPMDVNLWKNSEE
jgi:hypothetical protein